MITFADNSMDGDTYFWDFGDGNTSNSASPTHVYHTTGTYHVSLTVTDTLLVTDSTIVLPVAINSFYEVDVSVTQNGITLLANATDAVYQWLNCNDEFSIITKETNQLFTATQNGSYAVQVTQSNCVDTSACFSVTNVGILENTFSNENVGVYPIISYGTGNR